MFSLRPVPLYTKQTPRPNYRQHPAYGKFCQGITFQERIEAIQRLYPTLKKTWHEICTSYWQPERAHKAARQSGTPLLTYLYENGVVPFKITTQERDQLYNTVAPYIVQLQEKRQHLSGKERTFRDNVERLYPSDEKVISLVREILNARHIIEAAKVYLGDKIEVDQVFLQITNQEDEAVINVFSDLDRPDPATVYLHRDSDFRALKCMIYLSEVKAENGPFRYVCGSHRVSRSRWEEAIALSHDRLVGPNNTRPEERRWFYALPSFLQYKCQFGDDLGDDERIVGDLLRSEWAITSDYGNLILFDNRGFHRGSLIEAGERQVLQIVLREPRVLQKPVKKPQKKRQVQLASTN
jgi:hypothetical protein